jgi:hypothetical protein
MTQFKVLSKEEIAKLNDTDKSVYMENLAKYEAEQAKAKADAEEKVKADAEEKVKADTEEKAKSKTENTSAGNYLNDKEIEELKKHNPNVKQFYITSDKVAFPQLWLAIDHEKNIKGNPDKIQEIK